MTTDWILRIIEVVTPLLPKNFIGQIEINCVSGKVGNINLKQSFRKEHPYEPSTADRH